MHVRITFWQLVGTLIAHDMKSLKYYKFVGRTLKTTPTYVASLKIEIHFGIMIYHHNRDPGGEMFEPRHVSIHLVSSSGGVLLKSKYTIVISVS